MGPDDILRALTSLDGHDALLGTLAAGAVMWAMYENRKAERREREHAAELAGLRAAHAAENDRAQAEARRAQGDILQLATQYAQARAVLRQADDIHQATLADVMAALKSNKG